MKAGSGKFPEGIDEGWVNFYRSYYLRPDFFSFGKNLRPNLRVSYNVVS